MGRGTKNQKKSRRGDIGRTDRFSNVEERFEQLEITSSSVENEEEENSEEGEEDEVSTWSTTVTCDLDTKTAMQDSDVWFQSMWSEALFWSKASATWPDDDTKTRIEISGSNFVSNRDEYIVSGRSRHYSFKRSGCCWLFVESNRRNAIASSKSMFLDSGLTVSTSYVCVYPFRLLNIVFFPSCWLPIL